MDIYQILLTHNRPWSRKEILFFIVIVIMAVIILSRLVHYEKIEKSQACAILILFLFLGVVYGSTVFTRTVRSRKYELIPFWSWKEVLVNHNKPLIQENLLNCILLVPMGLLLPVIAAHKVRLKNAFAAGFLVSATIELCQLIFMRGLFEWDDMIHNGLGCMAGCFLGNILFRIIYPEKERRTSQ